MMTGSFFQHRYALLFFFFFPDSSYAPVSHFLASLLSRTSGAVCSLVQYADLHSVSLWRYSVVLLTFPLSPGYWLGQKKDTTGREQHSETHPETYSKAGVISTFVPRHEAF